MEQRPNRDGVILIVDDHRLTIDLLRDLLAGAFPELAILSAVSAEEAITLCETAMPRLVILDIGLPGMTGIDAARRIKALSPIIRVVVHSSHDDAIYREECTAAGVDAFVSKAHTHAELVPAVARLLSLTPKSGSGS
jgi:two-component system invasion response regulator UvrY